MQNTSEGGQNHQSEPQRRTNQQLQRPHGHAAQAQTAAAHNPRPGRQTRSSWSCSRTYSGPAHVKLYSRTFCQRAGYVRKTAKRRAHVRGLRARWCGPLRRFQTATGVPLTAPTASCDVPELPSPEPCLAYAWSRPAENRLTHTYRPTAATSRRPRWPPTPSRRPLQPGRSTGYRRAGRPSLRSRFPSCRSRLSEAAPKITSERHMRSTPLCSGQIVQLRDHHAERVGNGDGLKGRTRSSPAKFVLMPHPHRISPQPAIAATRPRRP